MTIRAKSNNTAEALNTLFHDFMLDKRTALPGKVAKVNYEANKLITLDIQPAIQQVVTQEDGLTTSNQTLPVITGVPFVLPRSQVNGYSLTIPITVGDDVLIIFSDRSLDNWQETGKVSPPSEPTITRTHDLTDAIAIPGISNNVNTRDLVYYTDRIALVKDDGTAEISLSGSDILIRYGASNIVVNNGEITMTSNGASSITIMPDSIVIDSSNVVISGASFNLASTSNTTTGGGLTTSGGVTFDSHVHSDPQGGNTGAPINP